MPIMESVDPKNWRVAMALLHEGEDANIQVKNYTISSKNDLLYIIGTWRDHMAIILNGFSAKTHCIKWCATLLATFW